jgi:hypothetical protein
MGRDAVEARIMGPDSSLLGGADIQFEHGCQSSDPLSGKNDPKDQW